MRRSLFSRFFQSPKSPTQLIVISSVWLASFGNLALWRSLSQLPDIQGWHSVLFGAVFGVLIAGVSAALLFLFAWRWTLKPAISVFLLLAAFASHYMLTYGIVVDTPMLVNVLQTDVREAQDQLNGRLFITVLLLAGLPLLWLWKQPVHTAPWKPQILRNSVGFFVALALALGALQGVFQDFASLMRNHTQMRYQINPLNSIYAVLNLTVIPSKQARGPLQALGRDASLSWPTASETAQRPPLLVFVLGETARSANFSLNGYARPTNPELAKENVTSFTQVKSCGTSTAESLPCMFSHLERSDFMQRTQEFENLLDVLQHAGYAVLWIDNQSGCKSQCDRVPTVNTSALKLAQDCDGGECRDTVMLARIDAELAKLPVERRARGTVVVMHQMGSHGPAYFKRSPANIKPFQPECKDTSLSNCERAQVVNAYDNSIAFTDHFLARTIGWLKGQEKTHTPALFYVSDHGESLGENGLYLHGLPYRVAPTEQTHVPLITWLSPSFERASRIQTRCLQAQREQALSHANVFHSVLGLMAVQTSAYDRERDLFAACRAARP